MTSLSYFSGAVFRFSGVLKKELQFACFLRIIISTEPNTPLNDADHVGSFNF